MALGSCSTAASCSRLVDENGLASSTGGRRRASTWQLQLSHWAVRATYDAAQPTTSVDPAWNRFTTTRPHRVKVRTGDRVSHAECVPLPLCHTRALQRYVPSLWGLARVPASPDSQVLVRGTSAVLPVWNVQFLREPLRGSGGAADRPAAVYIKPTRS